MVDIINVHEAKAHLSELLARVEAGESIVISRRNKPVARLVAVEKDGPKKPRPMGLARGEFTIHPAFFQPMTEDELADWYDIKPTDPLHPDWTPEP